MWEEALVSGGKMGVIGALTMIGKLVNDVLSFVIFSVLDVLDLILCYVYKIIDFFIEAEWKPCYCSSPKEAITGSGKILVSEKGESKKIVCLTSTKLQLEEISDTLYTRPSLVAEVSKTTVKELKRRKISDTTTVISTTSINKSTVRSTFTVNNTIVEMLQEKIGAHKSHPTPRSTKSKYRLFAIDLLGFGKSPKPHDSLYTMKEHLDMIERSVLDEHKVKSFHIVAHSLGCILALALAVKYPNSVKSLTLLAPPYFPTPKGEQATQYMMRKVAPRRVWPLIAFGASLACWYEHVSRTICLLICKNHRIWEFLTKLITRNRIKTYLIKGFCCHTHNAAWHTLHNIICGTAGKIEGYLDTVQNQLNCSVNVFHGEDDELIPVECSANVKTKVPRAHVKVVKKKDHITIVVGRQEAFARELEEIWRNSKTS
ncbi:Alpha/beta hydrolase fold-1 [Cynara cardunculus var. scolymus]|uniref:Alpha/beta hydrolase fold-1 n=1 Tax=Cynara cardunculus var. scolymus TaxID=59895 RepID=A0A103UZQ9_CYNCS|nr:Alpha/beta hydrolase fold-1 [Cynara cardunculus var. scolymus]